MAQACRALRRIQNINRGVFHATQTRSNILSRPSLSSVPDRLSSGGVGAKHAGSVAASSKKRDPAPFFFNDEIQSCLLEMNMRDVSQVFEPRLEGQPLKDDVEIKFLTGEELKEAEEKAMETARYFLQVPPVLSPRDYKPKILSKDPALQGLEESKILITDISYGVPHRERLVVARDPDGTLRYASLEEHSRMIQTYFPDESKTLETPPMFSSSNLKSLWERSEFAFVLDRACVQFEPDDPEYVSITSATYEYINDNGKYDDLLGTRHYGTLAFYLAFNGKLDKFLNHCISSYRIQDAVSLIRVFYLSRPDITDYKQPSTSDDTEFIKEYISKHSTDKAALSLTLNAYLELQLPTAADGNAM